MIYMFKKGEFKKMNDMNQDMKHIFTRYSLYNKIVVGELVNPHGKHYAKVDYSLPGLPDNIIVTISSQLFFNTQKEYKKFITGYQIDNENLYLILDGMENVLIGTAIDSTGLAASRKLIELKEARELIESSREYIKLTDDEMDELLVFKTKICIQSGKFKVYLTKDIIPNLKKNDYVDIAFAETNNKTVFQMIIRICRGGTTLTHHVYKCIYI